MQGPGYQVWKKDKIILVPPVRARMAERGRGCKMTLDVTIGKIVLSKYDPEWDDTTVVRVEVEQCPSLDFDLCKHPEFTLWPRDAYRSGSSGSSGFWAFFQKCVGEELYNSMRDHPGSNDRDVARLKPLIEKIARLPDECGSAIDNDRMKWFKFWCSRAVSLYGDDAGVQFS